MNQDRGWYASQLKETDYLSTIDFDLANEIIKLIQGLNQKSIQDLRDKDFNWPKQFIPFLDKALEEIKNPTRLGFHIIRGLPVKKLTEYENEILIWGVGKYLGTTGAQDSNGLHIGDVKDIGADPRKERQYKTNGAIAFHCDAADVVGLLCLSQAENGGLSRIASSQTIYNELIRQVGDANKLQPLYQPIVLDTRGTGGIPYVRIRPFACDSKNVTRTFYHAEYFRSAYPLAGEKPSEVFDLLDLYDRISNRDDIFIDLEFQAGDLQLLSNHFIVHSRTAYQDSAKSSRHLKRLWLTLKSEDIAMVDKFSSAKEIIRILGSFAYGKLIGKSVVKI